MTENVMLFDKIIWLGNQIFFFNFIQKWVSSSGAQIEVK